MQNFQHQLINAAKTLFQLEVDELLPVGESFASEVIRFHSGNQAYVLKRPFSVEKSQREYHWLSQLSHLDCIPEVYDWHADGYVLMVSLPGMPLNSFAQLADDQLLRLGRSIREVHATQANNFDGFSSWHALLKGNIERYLGMIAGADSTLAQQAAQHFLSHMHLIPDSQQAKAVHFDLRAGNILVDGDRYSGIIDFESMRGGHPSMDFFKLLTAPADLSDPQLAVLLRGYGQADWLIDSEQLRALMSYYRIYHGLAGLAWCSSRHKTIGEFYDRSVDFLTSSLP